MFTKELKDTLALSPGLLSLYLNQAGDWAFSPLPGYDTEFTAEEVLAYIEIEPAKTKK